MNLKEQYQKRLEQLHYLNLDEILNITNQYFSEIEIENIVYPFFENPLEFSLKFYDRINSTWGELLREFVLTPNFRYWPHLPREDCGYWCGNQKNDCHIMISKQNTIEDVFIMVHEFGHFIAEIYGLYSSPLTQEVVPILMEYLLMITYKRQDPMFETYYKNREQEFNTVYAGGIIKEIEFIQKCTDHYQLKRDLTTNDLKMMKYILETDSLDVKFSYIVGEYYLEDYKKLEKRKGLHKNL